MIGLRLGFRVHALDSDTLIVDAGSTNGVVVNEELVRAQRVCCSITMSCTSGTLVSGGVLQQRKGAPRLLPEGLVRSSRLPAHPACCTAKSGA